jgi:aldehyde:ferredoxin oxidoreductase
MLDGDPRWAFEFMRLCAEGFSAFGVIMSGSYHMYKEWGLDDATKNSAGKNYYDEVNGKNTNVSYNGYPKHHASEDAWQSGLLFNTMYNRDCMIHHLTNVCRSGSPYEEVIKPVMESFFGEGCVDAPKAYTPINENKVKLAKWAFNGKQWHDSATLCNWMYPMTLAIDPKRGYKGDLSVEAQYMAAITGEDWTEESLDHAVERCIQLHRAMTIMAYKTSDMRNTHDVVAEWVYNDEKAYQEGNTYLRRADWQDALSMFYAQFGWNENGAPTRETLEKFDLKDVADDLEALGLLG